MNTYFAMFKTDYKTNEFAQVLALIAILCSLVFGGLLLIGGANGAELTNVANTVTLPALFWGLAIGHLFARPAVLLHYSKK